MVIFHRACHSTSFNSLKIFPSKIDIMSDQKVAGCARQLEAEGSSTHCLWSRTVGSFNLTRISDLKSKRCSSSLRWNFQNLKDPKSPKKPPRFYFLPIWSFLRHVLPSGNFNIAIENGPFLLDWPTKDGWFSIARLVYQRVPPVIIHFRLGFSKINQSFGDSPLMETREINDRILGRPAPSAPLRWILTMEGFTWIWSCRCSEMSGSQEATQRQHMVQYIMLY